MPLEQVLSERLPKRFHRGTHRLAAPEDTLARVRPLAKQMGITRLGNITGLDRIGIPTAVAVRPNSRSVSVSQGKGLGLPAALASALMEACEGFHAEEIGPLRRGSYRDLARSMPLVDPVTLCPGFTPFDATAAINWIEGYDLLRGAPCWVPAEIVHTDYTIPQPDGFFLCGSNGLASGNHLTEAINSALYEIIERDAVALWIAQPLLQRVACALDLASVDDPDCRGLLAQYQAVEIDVRVWNITTDVGIAAFLCEIRDRQFGDPDRATRHHGSGCHADRRVALSRALTEAAQTRLTYITGIRDDLSLKGYQASPEDEYNDVLIAALLDTVAAIPFAAVPDFVDEDLGADLRWTLGRLGDIGIERVIAVDLTRPEFAIPVVRAVVPGLEWDAHHPNYRPGPRAVRET